MKWANSILLILFGLAITSGTGMAANSWSVSQNGNVLEIAYGSGTNFNQYAALHLDSSHLRMNSGPDSGWGTAVFLSPSFWPLNDGYKQGAPISYSKTNDGEDLLIHFEGELYGLGFEGVVRMHPPARDQITADVSVSTSGNVELAKNRDGEAFKPMMLASMHISEDRWDTQQAYAGSKSFPIPLEGWINDSRIQASRFGLLGGSSAWKANAPTVDIILEGPMKIAGWNKLDQNPNNDTVGFWAASDTVMPSWNYTIVSRLYGCYTGAYLGCGSEDSSCQSMKGFNQATGKNHALFMKYVDIADSQNTDIWDWVQDVKANGAVPVFMYDPYGGLNSIDNAKVEYFATKCKELDTRVLIIFGHEMNGNWYAWGQKPADYIARFKQVAEIFHRIAPRAEMCWVPNQNWGYPWGGTDHGDGYTEYYPSGSGTYGEYVDWVGLVFYDKDYDQTGHVSPGFFRANIRNGNDSMDFYQTFSIGKNKPMLIGETGAFDPNIDPTAPEVRNPLSDVMQDSYKNEWISEVYDASELESEFPRLKGVLYFNVLKMEPSIETQNHTGKFAFSNISADYRIPAEPNIYQQRINDPYFLGGIPVLYYPDFTDTGDPNSWRSWLMIQNLADEAANIQLELRDRAGVLLYAGGQTIPANGVAAIRPRHLAGVEFAGSAKVTSDKPIAGSCEINRNNNQMCMSYNAIDHSSNQLFYPDFTDTGDPNSWRSWLMIQNPAYEVANIQLELRDRAGVLLYAGSQTIPANGVATLRPRHLAGVEFAGSAAVTSDKPIAGSCEINRNNNLMCMSYNAIDHGSNQLFYPDFTDTGDPNSWRSWLMIQNPADEVANIQLELRDRAGGLLYAGSQTIPANGVATLRPRHLAGVEFAGSAMVTSDRPIAGACEINRNNNLMCMSYNAIDHGSNQLFYPDFTDTGDLNSWRSWLMIQNLADEAANIQLELRDRAGGLLYAGSQTIPANGVATLRPRHLAGVDFAGSAVVTSDRPIAGACEINRNNNLMCMSYAATRAASVDWLPSV